MFSNELVQKLKQLQHHNLQHTPDAKPGNKAGKEDDDYFSVCGNITCHLRCCLNR